jgi:hypothetical protein
MRLAYTRRVTVDENGLYIRRLGSGTESVPAIDIASDISVRAISFCPDKADGSYPVYYVKGIQGGDWAKVQDGVFEMDGLMDNVALYGRVKAESGETITLNVYVKGQ